MPTWAKVLAAPTYANQLVVDPLVSLMSAVKAGGDLYGDYNASDAVGQLSKMGSAGDVNAYNPDGFMSVEQRAKVDAIKKKRLAELYATEAAPIAQYGQSLLTDTEFRNNPEALQDFQNRPDFWTGGAGKLNNPNVVDTIKSFSTGAKAQEVQGNTGRAIKSNQANPFAAMDEYTLGQIQGSKDSVDNIGKIAELGGKERSGLATAEFFKGVATAASEVDPIAAYNKFSQVAANTPYVDKDAQKVGLDLMKQKFPEMKFEKAFTGKGEQQQLKALNPLTGAAVGDIGEAGLPSAPKISVQNVMPAQETAFAKAVGEANAKQYADAVAQKAGSEKAINTIDDYLTAAEKTYSGMGSNANYLLVRANPIKTKAQKEMVKNYETAITKSKEMAMDILTNFKGAISDGERIFAKEMSINPDMSPAAQKQLAAISKKNHKTQIDKADVLIKAVESDSTRSNINKTLTDSKRPPLESFRR